MTSISVEKTLNCVVASRDVYPGEEIWREEKPLILCRHENLNKYTRTDKKPDAPCLAYYMYTNIISLSEKQLFQALFAPCPRLHSDHFRKLCAQTPHPYGPSQDQNEEACVTFIDVCNVVRRHGVQVDSNVAVFELFSKIAHSCSPNCTATFEENQMICRAILPIKSGERVTVCKDLCTSQPTHQRRKHCLAEKDFTCHCSRCDAKADDTREFDCFDPQCPGSCFACQPLSKDPLPCPDMKYTGVEYVEPHLLPCTVCRRAPPLKYQEDMFALEPTLSGFSTTCNELYSRVAPTQFMEWLTALHVPRNHTRSLEVAHTKFDAAMIFVRMHGTRFELIETAAQEVVRLLAHVRVHMTNMSSLPHWQLAEDLIAFEQRSALSLQIARDCAEQALRRQLIWEGRETRDDAFDATLVKVLKCLATPPATLDHCMFCGESPLRAAITLSRCSRCRQVTYCSAGCQRAHWPLHKKTCCAK